MLKRKQTCIILIIFLVGLLLRLGVLFKYGEMWNDELFSVAYSQRPWLESITKFWVWETNPPLHMLILKLWFYLAPIKEWTARLPSLVFGLWSILAIYSFLKRIATERLALLAATIAAISPLFIFHSITARAYSLLMLLTVLSVDYFYRIFFENDYSRNNRLKYALINLLLLYTHFTALGVLITQAVALLVLRKSGRLTAFERVMKPAGFIPEPSQARKARRWSGAQIYLWIRLNFIPFSLWLIWAIPSLAHKFNGAILGQAWYFVINNSFINVTKMLQLVFTGPGPWQFGLAIMVAFGIGAVIINLKFRNHPICHSERSPDSHRDEAEESLTIARGIPPLAATLGRNDNLTEIPRSLRRFLGMTTLPFLLLSLFAFIPLAGAIALRLTNPRFMIIALPWVIVIMAYVISETFKNKWTQIALFLIFVPGIIQLWGALPITNWKPAINYLRDHLQADKKQLVVYNELSYRNVIDYYFPPNLTSLAVTADYYADWDYYYIIHNYLTPNLNEEKIKLWMRSNAINSYDELFVIQSKAVAVDAVKLLAENGWKTANSMPVKAEHEVNFVHLVKH